MPEGASSSEISPLTRARLRRLSPLYRWESRRSHRGQERRVPLTGVEIQAESTAKVSLRPSRPYRPAISLSKHRHGNAIHQRPRSRTAQPLVFSFHRPETLAAWLPRASRSAQRSRRSIAGRRTQPRLFLVALRHMPPLRSMASGPRKSRPSRIWKSRWLRTAPAP